MELMKFSFEPPFITMSDKIFEHLKEKCNFDFNSNPLLIKGKEDLFGFLSSVPESRKFLLNQLKKIKNIILKKNYLMGLISKIKESISSILFLFNLFTETETSLTTTQKNIANIHKIETYFYIGKKTVDRNFTDPKEIAFYYSKGDICEKIDDWKENIGFKKFHLEKY